MAEATHLPQALGKAMAMLESLIGDKKDQIVEVYEKDGALKLAVTIDIAADDDNRSIIGVDVGINFIVTRVKVKESSTVSPGQDDLPGTKSEGGVGSVSVNEAQDVKDKF